MTKVYGSMIDNETRCIHYHSFLDIMLLNSNVVINTILVINVIMNTKHTLFNVGVKMNSTNKPLCVVFVNIR